MKYPNAADHARALGLQVGDTIEGTEHYGNGRWSTARLTLLWLGKEEAMWRVTAKAWDHPKWSQPRESGNWALCCRDWQVLPPEVA